MISSYVLTRIYDYSNPPGHLAELFASVLPEYPQYRHISFAIFDDHNANKTHNPHGNVKPFRDVFEPATSSTTGTTGGAAATKR